MLLLEMGLKQKFTKVVKEPLAFLPTKQIPKPVKQKTRKKPAMKEKTNPRGSKLSFASGFALQSRVGSVLSASAPSLPLFQSN